MDAFNKTHLQNIRAKFEEKTGLALDAKQPFQRGDEFKIRRQYGWTAIRRSTAVVAAAVLLLSMVGFACAAILSGGFAEYFSIRTGGTLSLSQYQFIEEKSVGIGQSLTVDSYTVTIDSAICDAHDLYLIIHIEGPEGTRLDYPPDEGSCFFDYKKLTSTGTTERTGYTISYGHSWIYLDDGDGKENTVSLLLQEQWTVSPDSNRTFTDGMLWRLQLADLTVWRGAPIHEEEELLAEGGWSFEFPLSELSGEAELISSPVICTALAGGEGSSKERIDLLITSFVLSPFSATCSYRFLPGLRPESVDILDVHLVMKDGSTVTAQPSAGGGAGGIGFNSGTMVYTFDAPVMLEDVAYLVLPEDVLIPSPRGGSLTEQQ